MIIGPARQLAIEYDPAFGKKGWAIHPYRSASTIAWYVSVHACSCKSQLRKIQLPGEPTEPTSTIVLTSKNSYFVDVRIFRNSLEHDKGKDPANLQGSLQWAFAGRSRKTEEQKTEGEGAISWHNVWDHWIDSKDDKPNCDEGDMIIQEDGSVLEKGVNVDVDTGMEEHYEEMWENLPVEAFGATQKRSCVAVEAYHPENHIRGLVVKVGGWCQGIVKKHHDLTVERWRHQTPDSFTEKKSSSIIRTNESTQTRKDWVRVFRAGAGTLPCEVVCSHSEEALGYDSTFSDGSGIAWRIIEEYYY